MRQVDIFKHLDDEQIARVVALGEPRTVRNGSYLAHTDEPADTLYIIRSGEAELSYGSAGNEIAVRVARANETFPWAALRGSGNLVTNCRAITDMEVVAIPIAALTEFCDANPALGMRIYRAAMDMFAGQYGRTLAMLAANVDREVTASGTPSDV